MNRTLNVSCNVFIHIFSFLPSDVESVDEHGSVLPVQALIASKVKVGVSGVGVGHEELAADGAGAGHAGGGARSPGLPAGQSR